jgi:signal transduction histidine kinase
LIVSGLVTNLVQAIYRADWQRTMAIQDAVHIDKLASVGRMAAGVAHEINNPLAIIKEKAGFLGDLLAHRYNDETTVEKMQGLVESIDRAVLRCTVIMHRVLDFSRPDTKTKQVVEPSAIIKEIIDFFEKDINRRGIRVRVHVDDNLPVFASERGKLQQIFLNLISNAFDALDDNGHLDVTIAKKDPKQIQITFSDNGHGIAADDINRVFEPFFTTKIHTGGTGLGLFITSELVDELQGQIRVESTEGIGTCFFLTLPTGN